MFTWDLRIFGNTIGNKDRGEIIACTWFHSFFSRKKSEIRIAFTFFEKWKVKNKIPSLFFEKWKWNWNGSRTRGENEKKISRILEKRESRWSLGLTLHPHPPHTVILTVKHPFILRLPLHGFLEYKTCWGVILRIIFVNSLHHISPKWLRTFSCWRC